jgi:hypothetical protein
MITGAADLLQSERGVFALLVLLAATVLTALRVIDGSMWIEFAKYLCTALIASKTVTTAVETYTTRQPQIPRAEVVKP